jgi:hypothetical protein
MANHVFPTLLAPVDLLLNQEVDLLIQEVDLLIQDGDLLIQ